MISFTSTKTTILEQYYNSQTIIQSQTIIKTMYDILGNIYFPVLSS